MIQTRSENIKELYNQFRHNNAGIIHDDEFGHDGGCGFLVFYFGAKNAPTMAYSSPKLSENENVTNMLNCQKAMGEGRLWVFNEDPNNFPVLEDGMHPTLTKAKPSVGICIYKNKVVMIKFCPSYDDQSTLSGAQAVTGRDRMTFPMAHNPLSSALEGIGILEEVSANADAELKTVADHYDRINRI